MGESLQDFQKRDLVYTFNSIFPQFSSTFFDELVVVSVAVVVGAMLLYILTSPDLTTGRSTTSRQDHQQYEWPDTTRQNRPLLHILTQVLDAVSEGVQRYQNTQHHL